MGKKGTDILRITPNQMAYAFHKFIHHQRNNGILDDWNKLDEEAYQAALTAVFEFKEEVKR